MNRKLVFFAATMCAAAGAFSDGTLQLGEATVEDNQVVFPVILGGDVGRGVSAMDFRLNYDPTVLAPVSAVAGPAAIDAGKSVMANVRRPGEYVVVMMGMNQTTCTSGEVVTIIMQRIGESQDTGWDVNLVRPTLSSLEGNPIDVQVIPSEGMARDDSPEEKENAENANDSAETPAEAAPVVPVIPGLPRGVKDAPAGITAAPKAGAPVDVAPVSEHRLGGQARETNRTRLAAAAAAADRIREGIHAPVDHDNGVKPGRSTDDVRSGRLVQDMEAGRAQGETGTGTKGSGEALLREQQARVTSGANKIEYEASRVVVGALKGPEKRADPSRRTGLTLGIICVIVIIGIGFYAFRRRLLN